MRVIELAANEKLLEELGRVLSKHPGIQQILVSRRTLRNALTGFLDGKVNATELVEWANRVERRNDEIAYESGYEQFIATFVFRLSTPEINQPISRGLCREMIAELAADSVADQPPPIVEPFTNVTRAYETRPTHRCPCCRFKTLYGRGQDEICQVCFWQDDGQDEHDADLVRGGPNRELSLREARINFTKYGASEPRYLAKVRDPLPHER